MTEEEAKKKWCPMTHIQYQSTGEFQCIGSWCMMWRLIPKFEVDGNEQLISTEGYCGLAGKP